MAASSNCVGNFIMWIIGQIILQIAAIITPLCGLFGLWGIPIDIQQSIMTSFGPVDFVADDGAANTVFMESIQGVTSCKDATDDMGPGCF